MHIRQDDHQRGERPSLVEDRESIAWAGERIRAGQTERVVVPVAFDSHSVPRARTPARDLDGTYRRQAARRIVQSQAMAPLTVWVTVLGWIVAIAGVVSTFAAGAEGAAATWVVVGAVVNVLAVVGAQLLGRALVRSTGRMLLPAIQPLDQTATVQNLTRIFSRKPTYFATLARKHPGMFPAAG